MQLGAVSFTLVQVGTRWCTLVQGGASCCSWLSLAQVGAVW